MIKVGIFIPIKTNSTRVPGKNFTIIGDKPLYQYTFDVVSELQEMYSDTNIELDFYVDTDLFQHEPTPESDKFMESLSASNISLIERDPELAKDTANGDDLLKYHITNYPEYDIYSQLYITCPFQKASSISDCLSALTFFWEKDSSFLIYENHTWFWYDGKPINYTPGELLRSQDAKPVINETTGFYAIRKEAWKKTRCRIGKDPYMRSVTFLESIDIDNLEDLQLAKIIADAKL